MQISEAGFIINLNKSLNREKKHKIFRFNNETHEKITNYELRMALLQR
jgi:hypothetical protein